MRARKERIQIRLIGLLELESDVEPELARAVIDHVWVWGVVSAPKKVRRVLRF